LKIKCKAFYAFLLMAGPKAALSDFAGPPENQISLKNSMKAKDGG